MADKTIRSPRIFLAASCFVLIFQSLLCRAEVITTTEITGPANHIYVAGNPDLYPIEYYDAHAKCYKGMMPEILLKVSEETGLSFVYIGAGKKNRQSQFIQSKQVDIVTAIERDDYIGKDVPVRLPVFTSGSGEERTEIYLGFTATANAEIRERITNAINGISDEEKAASAIFYAINGHQSGSDKKIYMSLTSSIILIIIITLSAMFIIRKIEHKKSTQINMTDALTGIGNKNHYIHSYEAILEKPTKKLYYVAYIAPDEIKARALVGDEEFQNLQIYAAEHLKVAAESTDFISYIANNAFVFLYQSINKEASKTRINDILTSLKKSLGEIHKEYAALYTAGICSIDEVPESHAEEALSYAKQGFIYALSNRLPYAFSTKEILSKNKDDRKLISRLNKAIENKEFKIYMQFIVDKKTEKVCGAEILSRWQNPELGLIKPDRYINIMKQAGKIAAHDYYMFEHLCLLLEKWSGTKYASLFLTCNFTRISVSDFNFTEKIREISNKYKFDHDKLIIEMTEDSLTEDSARASKNIEACHAMGFKFAIDDMGSGFSSLSDLYGNNIDMVKIERNLVLQGVTERGNKLLNIIIALVHSMNALVLCEGIETEQERAMIKKTACDMIQGYYYSHVLPFDEGLRYLESMGFGQ